MHKNYQKIVIKKIPKHKVNIRKQSTKKTLNFMKNIRK